MVRPAARFEHGRHRHVPAEIPDTAGEKKRNHETAGRPPVEGSAEDEFTAAAAIRNLRRDGERNRGPPHGGDRDGVRGFRRSVARDRDGPGFGDRVEVADFERDPHRLLRQVERIPAAAGATPSGRIARSTTVLSSAVGAAPGVPAGIAGTAGESPARPCR